ncbi:MAG TPA: hypothetical protein VGF93_14015 [Solirubrobacteraceae bacterium]
MSTTSSGPGQVSEAEQPFVDAIVAAAKAAGKETAGDPMVTAAFGLGWLMGDILAGRPGPPFPVDLPLPESAGFKSQGLALTTLAGKLKIDGLDPKAVTSVLGAGTKADSQAAAWQPDLAAALVGADSRLSRAYGLGQQLNRLGNAAYTSQLFAQPWIAAMIEALDALTSALAPHAARSVAISIMRWEALQSAPAGVETLLPAQCELWRTILAGEKKGTELLEPDNYLDAAERLGDKLRMIGRSALKKFPWLVGAIVVLFVGGIVLLIVGTGGGTTAAAGLSAVLAAFGLTWKGVGGAVGKLAGKLEAPLWGAELDGAIADAITLAHEKPAMPGASAAAVGDYAARTARVFKAAGKPLG